MKVNKLGILTTTIFLASMVGVEVAVNKKNQNNIEKYKSAMLQQAPKKFEMVNNSTKNIENVYAAKNIWQDEYAKMQDSIKKAGLSQKALFEGNQLLNKTK